MSLFKPYNNKKTIEACASVRKITDQKKLFMIATTGTNLVSRQQAVMQLTDQELLYQLTTTNTDELVLKIAAAGITKQEYLKLIVNSSLADVIKKIVYPKISDPNLSEDLYYQVDDDIRIILLKNISDIPFYRKLATTTPTKEIVTLVLNKNIPEDIILDFLKIYPGLKLSNFAIANLIPKLSDVQVIEKLVSDIDSNTYLDTIFLLLEEKDRLDYRYILKHSKHYPIQEYAVLHTQDDELIYNYIINAPTLDLYALLSKRVSSNVLIRLLTFYAYKDADQYYTYWTAVLSYITDISLLIKVFEKEDNPRSKVKIYDKIIELQKKPDCHNQYLSQYTPTIKKIIQLINNIFISRQNKKYGAHENKIMFANKLFDILKSNKLLCDVFYPCIINEFSKPHEDSYSSYERGCEHVDGHYDNGCSIKGFVFPPYPFKD